jgi:hypothetical protein
MSSEQLLASLRAPTLNINISRVVRANTLFELKANIHFICFLFSNERKNLHPSR